MLTFYKNFRQVKLNSELSNIRYNQLIYLEGNLLMTGKKTIISCTKYSTKSFSNVLLDSKNLKLYHDLFHYIYGMDAVFAVTCTMLARGYFHGIFQGL